MERSMSLRHILKALFSQPVCRELPKWRRRRTHFRNGIEVTDPRMRIVARAWATYQQLLITHPWKTQTIGTGVLVAAGDVVTQQFVEQKGLKHDFVRTARMAVVGLIIGPILRTWYLTLDRLVPGAAKTAGFKKMLLDQSLFAPVITCFFFVVTETLAGKRLRDIKEMLQERYVDVLITNYKIWPLAQTLNFTFVPIQHRVGFVQIVAIFWNAYLSWMTNKPSPEPTLDSVNSI